MSKKKSVNVFGAAPHFTNNNILRISTNKASGIQYMSSFEINKKFFKNSSIKRVKKVKQPDQITEKSDDDSTDKASGEDDPAVVMWKRMHSEVPRVTQASPIKYKVRSHSKSPGK